MIDVRLTLGRINGRLLLVQRSGRGCGELKGVLDGRRVEEAWFQMYRLVLVMLVTDNLIAILLGQMVLLPNAAMRMLLI